MKAIVVAGGDAVPGDAAWLIGADLVIAADSGADWLHARGRRPDMVVGDMDSINPALLEALARDGVALVRHPRDKDASDAELAVERAVASGADQVVVIGALGGARLDHELANLLLLAEPAWARIDLRVVRGPATVRALHGPNRLPLEGRVGSLVTLLPTGGDAVGVRTDGLRFALDRETLALGRSRGLSNTLVRSPASVSLERGTLLVIETQPGGMDELDTA